MNIKKITALAAALALALSLSACNSDNGGGTAEADVSTTTAAATKAAKDETTTAKPEETTEATTTEPVVEATPVTDFDYEEADGEITITKYNGSESEVIIPAEIDGKPVTAIGYEAFKYSSITSVVIPEGVKTIYEGAFYNCGKLADVTLPESITNIYYGYWSNEGAESPFTGSPWLENKRAENPLVIVNNILVDGQTCSRDVEIPDGVRVIAGGAFNGCTTITSVKLPDSLKTVGVYAFTKCERLTEIILPDSVSYIGNSAFSKCRTLENVTFPNNTVEMGGYIFGDMRESDYDYGTTPWLEKKVSENPLLIINGNLINAQKCTGDVVVPDDVKSIAPNAFSYFYGSGLTSVKLPEGITKIPNGLFYACNQLKSVNIPESVTEIGWSAFRETSLKSITIPNGVTKIGMSAFEGGWGNFCQFESITIPGSVTEIGDNAFHLCKNLKSITLSEGLKKIGSKAFSEAGITEMTLPDSLESIATDAFSGCNADITYKGEIYFPELYDELYKAINGQ